MMPLALGFLWLELQILERLTVPVETVQLRPVGGAAAWRCRCAKRLALELVEKWRHVLK